MVENATNSLKNIISNLADPVKDLANSLEAVTLLKNTI